MRKVCRVCLSVNHPLRFIVRDAPPFLTGRAPFGEDAGRSRAARDREEPLLKPGVDRMTCISSKPFIDERDCESYSHHPLETRFFLQPSSSTRNKGTQMPEVIVRKGEPIDRALKRLKSKLETEGIMEEVRRLRAFETPTQKSKRKAKSNAKRAKAKFRFNTPA